MGFLLAPFDFNFMDTQASPYPSPLERLFTHFLREGGMGARSASIGNKKQGGSLAFYFCFSVLVFYLFSLCGDLANRFLHVGHVILGVLQGALVYLLMRSV